jgi:uncharacterized membrane protein YfcA
MDFNMIIILVAGMASGFLNTAAGGGSLLSIPVLIFIGLPSAVANGTNRIALLAESITAIITFRKKGYFDPKLAIILGIPAVIGSIIGSKIAVNISNKLFNNILALVMVLVVLFILWQPHKKFAPRAGELSPARLALAMAGFFMVGLYGGFIQVGVGFLIITCLSLTTGKSLVDINSLKVLISLIYLIPSLLVFVQSGKVNWSIGFVLAIGNGIGGWLGSSLSVKGGDKWIKIILVIAVTLMVGRLLGLY